MEQNKLVDTIELAMQYEDELIYEDMLDIQVQNSNSILSTFIYEYENRYNTKIKAIAAVGERYSHYGSIGGNGELVGVASEEIDFLELVSNCDEFEILITDDKYIRVVKHDHDGINAMDLVLLTENEVKMYYENEYDYFNLAEFAFINKKHTKLFGSVLSSNECVA